jgi:hypothetical protein
MDRTACTEPQYLYSTAIPLLPLWAVRPVQSLSACTRVHFTFYLHSFNPGSNPGPVNVGFGVDKMLAGLVFAPRISVFARQYVFTNARYAFCFVACIIQYRQLTDWLNNRLRNTEMSVRAKSYRSKYFPFRPARYNRFTSTKFLSFCLKIYGVSLTSVTAFLLQSRDNGCYVGRRILVHPPLKLHRHAHLQAHESAHSALVISAQAR